MGSSTLSGVLPVVQETILSQKIQKNGYLLRLVVHPMGVERLKPESLHGNGEGFEPNGIKKQSCRFFEKQGVVIYIWMKLVQTIWSMSPCQFVFVKLLEASEDLKFSSWQLIIISIDFSQVRIAWKDLTQKRTQPDWFIFVINPFKGVPCVFPKTYNPKHEASQRRKKTCFGFLFNPFPPPGLGPRSYVEYQG